VSYWRDWLHERFPDREILSRADARHRFWADLPAERLDEFFDMFELEYSVSVGILRPSDELTTLAKPIASRNSLRWLAVEPALEDKASELNSLICSRAGMFGLLDALPVWTVDEYVRVWCGVRPSPRQHPWRDQ
jgi:hypothetical protein